MKCAARRAWKRTEIQREEGAAVVEMALTCVVFLAMVFGVIQACLAFYTSNYVSDAAREATRWAIVRGSTSCTSTPNLTDCGATTTAQFQSYVESLGYPGINSSKLTVTPTWFSASSTLPKTWTKCATPCNDPGNQVQVQVSYSFPLGIPFWKAATVSVSSTSQMVISQ